MIQNTDMCHSHQTEQLVIHLANYYDLYFYTPTIYPYPFQKLIFSQSLVYLGTSIQA